MLKMGKCGILYESDDKGDVANGMEIALSLVLGGI